MSDARPATRTAASVTGLPAIDGLSVRPFDAERDWAPVAEHIGAAHVADGIEWIPTPERLRTEWELRPTSHPERDALVAESAGRLVAVVRVSAAPRADETTFRIELVVAPDLRRRGLGSALLGWAERRAREIVAEGRGGPDDLPRVTGTWAEVDPPATLPFATRHGYVAVRPFWIMIRDLGQPIEAAAMPDGLEIRPVRTQDHRPIWDADAEAFLDHYGTGPRTDDEFRAFFADPDLVFPLWQVGWDGDEVAGSVIVGVHEAENARLGIRHGWLEHVSVRRPWRGKGLARALVTAALVALREAGLEHALLGVDAANPTGAIQVYERTGFTVHRHAAILRKPLEI